MLLRGHSFHVDCYECAFVPDRAQLFSMTVEMIEKAGMQIVSHIDRRMMPPYVHKDNAGDDVMCLIIPLNKSNVDIHTWPAINFITIDLFTCGDQKLARAALEDFMLELGPVSNEWREFRRG